MKRPIHTLLLSLLSVAVLGSAAGASPSSLTPAPAASVAAPLSAAGQQKVRDALTFTGASFSFNFSFTVRRGFTLSLGFEDDDATPEALALAEYQKRPVPTGAEARADHYFQLANLAARANQDTDKDAALGSAAESYRSLLENAADSMRRGRYLARLGAVLSEQNSPSAEKTLREAADVAPNDWEAWYQLGAHLTSESFKGAFANFGKDANISTLFADPQSALAYLREHHPSAAERAKSAAVRKEAQACFERAAALAPQEARIHSARATAALVSGVQSLIDQVVRGESVGQEVVLAVFGRPELTTELDRAVQANPKDPASLVLAGFFRTLGKAGVVGPAFLEQLRADLLPRLTEIARDGGQSRERRLTAYQTVVTLHLASRNGATALEEARRGLELAPEDSRLRQCIIGAHLTEEKYDLARPEIERYLRQKDTARRRILLAKTCVNLGNLGDAEKVLDEAWPRYSDHAAYGLARAVVRLKNSAARPEGLKEAGAYLTGLSANTQPGALSDDEAKERDCALAAYHALSGDTVKANALLDDVLKRDPEHEEALALRAAVQ